MRIFDLFKPNIQKLMARGDVRGLVRVLKNSRADLRAEAASALDRLGWVPSTQDERSFYLLAKKQWTELSSVRQPAVKMLLHTLKLGGGFEDTVSALGEIRDPMAIPALIDQLYWYITREDYPQKEADLRGLGHALGMMDETALSPHVERIIAKGFAAKSMAERVPHPVMVLAGPSTSRIRALHAHVLARVGKGAFGPLLRVLRQTDHPARFDASSAIRMMTDNRLVPTLIEVLRDKDPCVRYTAAGALGSIGDPAAAAPLIEALSDDDTWVRAFAAEALGKIGDPAAVDPLVEALHDHEGLVRTSAVIALGKIGDPRAVAPLTQALSADDHLEIIVPRALGDIGHASALPTLETVASLGSYKAREEAHRAIEKIKVTQEAAYRDHTAA